MLQLQNIKKSFGSHLVYTIDECTLIPGIYRLKGANGSGKSTLLRMIAGMLPFKGDIFLNKTISVHKQPVDYRFQINYCPAEPVYPSFITGNELVEFVSGIKKGNKEQLDAVKNSLGIDNYLLNPTGSYSSGMLKKLSLLLAFTGNPQWILFDEPFTTLDQPSQAALIDLISQRHKQGTSFIITSHHDAEILHLSFTKTYLLKDQLLQEQVS